MVQARNTCRVSICGTGVEFGDLFRRVRRRALAIIPGVPVHDDLLHIHFGSPSVEVAGRASTEISAIASRVRKLAHETDGNDIAMTGNMAQAASDLIRNKAEALCSGMDEMLSLVNLCFSAIATNLQLKHAHKTLRDVRRALPA